MTHKMGRSRRGLQKRRDRRAHSSCNMFGKRDRIFGNPVGKCSRDGLLECQMEVCSTSQGPVNVLECHIEVCSTSQGPANVLECHMEVCSTSQGPANERDLWTVSFLYNGAWRSLRDGALKIFITMIIIITYTQTKNGSLFQSSWPTNEKDVWPFSLPALECAWSSLRHEALKIFIAITITKKFSNFKKWRI